MILIISNRPHGGSLVNRVLSGEKKEEAFHTASSLRKVMIDSWSKSDIECIAIGAFSPLKGFMNKDDYDSVVEEMRLANGLVWSIPIPLPVEEEVYQTVALGEKVCLVDDQYEAYAILTIEDKYIPDKEREALAVFKTADPAHPGVKKLFPDRITILVEQWMSFKDRTSIHLKKLLLLQRILGRCFRN